MADEIDIYASCDRMIREMNRDIIASFGRLKMAKWDRINIIRTVTDVYRRSLRKARKRYGEVYYDAYVLGMLMCGKTRAEAKRLADTADIEEMVDVLLDDVDPLTRYRFTEEAERKAYRLAESMEIATDRNLEIDRAMRYWSKQVAQYAILATDAALLEAFGDAEIEKAMWVTKRDEKVCHECRERDGKVYPIDRFPAKSHFGCRCGRMPVMRSSSAKAD